MRTSEDPQARWIAILLPALAAVLTATALASALLRPGDVEISWEGWGLPLVMAIIIAIGGRRLPATTLAVSAIALFAYYATGRPAIGFMLLLVPAIINAAERGALRAAALIGSAAMVIAFTIRIALNQVPNILGTQLLTEVGLLIGALLAGDALRSRRRWRAELMARQTLEREAAERELQARLDAERRRIGRDIHDAMGHTLVILSQQASLAIATFTDNPPKAREALEIIRSSVRSARSEVDEALTLLRSPTDDAAPAPSLRDLARLVERIRANGTHVSVTMDDVDAGAAVEATAFRIIQEATTNVERHSSSKRIALSVAAVGEMLRIEVTDDGGAAEGWSEGNGIVGMRERAALVGGRLDIRANATNFTVTAELPLKRPGGAHGSDYDDGRR